MFKCFMWFHSWGPWIDVENAYTKAVEYQFKVCVNCNKRSGRKVVYYG